MAAKLVNQALVGVHAQAACEAILLAEALGIKNLPALREVLGASWGQSRILDLVMNDYIAAKNEFPHSKNPAKEAIAKLSAIKSSAPLKNLDKDFSCIAVEVEEGSGELKIEQL